MLVSSRIGPLQRQNVKSFSLEDKPDSSLDSVELCRSSVVYNMKVVSALQAEARRELKQYACANITAEFRRPRAEFVKTRAKINEGADPQRLRFQVDLGIHRQLVDVQAVARLGREMIDRKSTRLNSSQ